MQDSAVKFRAQMANRPNPDPDRCRDSSGLPGPWAKLTGVVDNWVHFGKYYPTDTWIYVTDSVESARAFAKARAAQYRCGESLTANPDPKTGGWVNKYTVINDTQMWFSGLKFPAPTVWGYNWSWGYPDYGGWASAGGSTKSQLLAQYGNVVVQVVSVGSAEWEWNNFQATAAKFKAAVAKA